MCLHFREYAIQSKSLIVICWIYCFSWKIMFHTKNVKPYNCEFSINSVGMCCVIFLQRLTQDDSTSSLMLVFIPFKLNELAVV